MVHLQHEFSQEAPCIGFTFRGRDLAVVVEIDPRQDGGGYLHPRGEGHLQAHLVGIQRDEGRLKVFVEAVGKGLVQAAAKERQRGQPSNPSTRGHANPTA